jgi:hypothetical protein
MITQRVFSTKILLNWLAPKMKALRAFETSGTPVPTTERRMSAELSLHHHSIGTSVRQQNVQWLFYMELGKCHSVRYMTWNLWTVLRSPWDIAQTSLHVDVTRRLMPESVTGARPEGYQVTTYIFIANSLWQQKLYAQLHSSSYIITCTSQ